MTRTKTMSRRRSTGSPGVRAPLPARPTARHITCHSKYSDMVVEVLGGRDSEDRGLFRVTFGVRQFAQSLGQLRDRPLCEAGVSQRVPGEARLQSEERGSQPSPIHEPPGARCRPAGQRIPVRHSGQLPEILMQHPAQCADPIPDPARSRSCGSRAPLRSRWTRRCCPRGTTRGATACGCVILDQVAALTDALARARLSAEGAQASMRPFTGR